METRIQEQEGFDKRMQTKYKTEKTQTRKPDRQKKKSQNKKRETRTSQDHEHNLEIYTCLRLLLTNNKTDKVTDNRPNY